MKRLSCLITLCVSFGFLGGSTFAQEMFSWRELPELPTPQDQALHAGLTGHFAGVHADALIIAGGASSAYPTGESNRQYRDGILVLVRDGNELSVSYHWIANQDLDKPIAFGSAVSTSDGVLCMGGRDAERTYADVFLLRWNPETKDIEKQILPSLPQPCAYAGAAIIDNKVYVAGGTAGSDLETTQRHFWTLDLTNKEEKDLTWEQAVPWPGPSRAQAIVVAQHNGSHDCVYVISGQRIDEEGKVEHLTDVYEFTPARYNPQEYDPETGTYSGHQDPWKRRADVPMCVMAGTGIRLGQSHIAVLGGADGSRSQKTESAKEALAYHTITDTWVPAGPLPGNYLSTKAVRWGSDTVNDPIVIAGGEVHPHIHTSKVWQMHPLKSAGRFGLVDFSVIGLYLASMIGVGVFFSFRTKNADDFFRGGQRIPWFVAGLSIFATMLSSITFVAIPAKAFATNWVYFTVNMMAIALTPLVIWLFLPFFRKIDATSAYEYLEKRFNRLTRLFASASFILFQIGRMAVVMYLPALALATITPLSEQQCILLMGTLSIIYCTMGGLEAVVWTDTIQSFVLLGGAFFSFVLIITQIDGGLSGFFATAGDQHKFHMINWDFTSTSFATTALWVVVLGGIGQNLVPYTSDMAVVQRYMSVPDITRAKKAIWTNAVVILPASLLFFGVGTALFVFYTHHPDRLDPTFKTDAIFPLFIARELPTGIAGLVVAGIFSAAQSTISTSMNSTSTAMVSDFIRPLRCIHSERGYLQLGRVLTAVLGILGTLLALSFAASDIKSLWDQFMKILGLFGGPMCGLFCLGILTTRTNGPGAIVGAVAGAVSLFLVQQFTDIHLLLYAMVGISICFVCGYLASLAMPCPKKSIEGLTIHTLARSDIR